MPLQFRWEDLVLDKGQRKHPCVCCEPNCEAWWRPYNALGLFDYTWLGSLHNIQGHLNARGYIAILEQDMCSTLLAFGFNLEKNHFSTRQWCRAYDQYCLRMVWEATILCFRVACTMSWFKSYWAHMGFTETTIELVL